MQTLVKGMLVWRYQGMGTRQRENVDMYLFLGLHGRQICAMHAESLNMAGPAFNHVWIPGGAV